MQWLSIGECMAELGPSGETGLYRLGFGGDTLNTAIYLARLAPSGVSVGYMTRIGSDLFSASMRGAWADEGVDISLVEEVPGRVCGLYAISLDEHGERSFTYWRGEAPARELFTEGAVEARVRAMVTAKLVYFSGITLAILPEPGRSRLLEAATRARDAGATVAFDPNHRPALWASRDVARSAYRAACGAASIVLTGRDDELALFDDADLTSVLDRIAGCGCPEVVIKAGDAAARVAVSGRVVAEASAPAVRVVDATAAGDSFNAGYLAARLAGSDPVAALAAGHAVAGRVVTHRGAIVPRETMARP